MGYRLFVGNLPMDIKEREVDDLFHKYGKIKAIEIKTPPRPPAYAFVTFENEDDANDAIKDRNGYEFDDGRLRVEFAKGSGDIGDRDRRDNRGGGRGGKRRSDWRVSVTHLPRSTSWQDLKDFMRKAGDVIYADVDGNGDGVVEYSNQDDMEYAIRKLDDTEFRNSRDSSYVRVRSERGRDRDRSHHRRHRSSSKDRHRRSRSRDHSEESREEEEEDRRRHHRRKSHRHDSRERRKRSPSSSSSSPSSPPPPRDELPSKPAEKRSSTGDGDGAGAGEIKSSSRRHHHRARHGSISSADSDRDSRRKKSKKHRRDHSKSRSNSRDHSNGK